MKKSEIFIFFSNFVYMIARDTWDVPWPGMWIWGEIGLPGNPIFREIVLVTQFLVTHFLLVTQFLESSDSWSPSFTACFEIGLPRF